MPEKVTILTGVLIIHRLVPNPSRGIEERIKEYLLNIQKKTVFLQKNQEGRLWTIDGTLAFMKKELLNFEQQIVGLIPPLQEIYYTDPNVTNPFMYPSVWNGIIALAPMGLAGIECDSYYVLRLLLYGQYPIMFEGNPAQAKQWASYYEELCEITKLFTAVNREQSVENAFSVFFQPKYSKKKTMQISAKQFLAQTSCDAKTFANLIQAITLFTSEMYMAVLFYILTNNAYLKNHLLRKNLENIPNHPKNLPNINFCILFSARFLLKIQNELGIVIAYKNLADVFFFFSKETKRQKT